MPRTVREWKGRADDTAAPPRVRLRVWDRCEGKCHRCARKIMPGERWILEHLTALINGGENAEHNLGLTCKTCLPDKNKEDLAIKSKTAAVRAKHLGIRKPSSLQSQSFSKPTFKYSRARGCFINVFTGEPQVPNED